ncbi:unnamed protein product [Sphacelaria rigidula]
MDQISYFQQGNGPERIRIVQDTKKNWVRVFMIWTFMSFSCVDDHLVL